MSVAGVHHVGLCVGDLDAAEAWYQDALGYEPEVRAAFGPMRVTMGRLPGGTRLELLEHGGSAPGPAQGLAPNDALLTRGWAHIALDVEDIDAFHAKLLEAGAGEVWPPRPSPEPGVSMAFVRDPEGNLIELVSRDGGR